MITKRRTITAIDVGTSKVSTAIASLDRGKIELLGLSSRPSGGVRKGTIVNLSQAVDCIKSSLEEAERQAGTVAESALAAVGGPYVLGVNSSGSTEVHNRGDEISSEDVRRAVEVAHAFPLPDNSQILHILQRSFRVDGQGGISNPLGMQGRRLEANVHLILNASSVVNNLVNAINKTGVVVESVVVQQLAAGMAALSKDERELGTLIIDVGGGTTDVAVYRRGEICHSQSLVLGGGRITKDIAIGLKTTLEEAERLKRTKVTVDLTSVPDGDLVEVTGVGNGQRHSLSRQLLCQIAQARCDEILNQVLEVCQAPPTRKDLISGAVITGAGALLEGFPQRAQEILGLPVRRGFPGNVVRPGHEAYQPGLSAVLGLVRYARDFQSEMASSPGSLNLPSPRLRSGRKVRNWFLDRLS
ncbi:MAG: cell division protein FtsA [Acidobacteriota bacterium]